jgi:predicted site-specific integrase-resolvase
MDNYLSISDAINLTHFSESYLNQLIQVGTIKAVKLKSGEILVNENDVSKLPEMFAEFKGIPISIGQASREFSIPQPTISRWIMKGSIPVHHREGQKIFIDKAHIAQLVYLYKLNPGQGKWTLKKVNND